MLLCLVFRGVAFEFRWCHPRDRAFRDLAFAAGSIAVALAQGFVLGALLQGVKVTGRGFGGGSLDWLTSFSLLTGVSLFATYALLGSTWRIAKPEGQAQNKAYRLARRDVAAPFLLAIGKWFKCTSCTKGPRKSSGRKLQ